MYLHVWVLYIRVVCTGSDVMSEPPGCPRRPVPHENSYYLPLPDTRPCSNYVVHSRFSGRNSIRPLRDFDSDKLVSAQAQIRSWICLAHGGQSSII